MTDLSRRSALVGMGALAATAAAVARATPADATTPVTTTIIYSPHPDDETLRLGSYIQYAAAQGNRLILCAATDGDASNMKNILGITGAQMAAIRRGEQYNSWHVLTGGRGEILRMGQPDGGVDLKTMTLQAQSFEAAFGPYGPVEHYCACNPDDASTDHVAVANGVRAAGVKVVRCSTAPDYPHKGANYACPDLGIAQQSDAAYTVIGHPSVPGIWQALRDDNYASHVYLA